MKILYDWLNDLPQQFLEKERIEALIKAFSRQMEEVKKAFDELDSITNIDKATGKNLDMVGSIIPINRTEAYTILRRTKETTVSDDLYRQVLKYKMLKDTSSCTYYDIVESIHMLWNAGDVHYLEKEDSPATIFISINDADLDGPDSLYGRATAIKPAGVKMVYTQGYSGKIDESKLEKIRLVSVDTAIAIDFLRHSKLLDGTKFLDGSRRMDGVSPVGVDVSITSIGTFKKIEQSFGLFDVGFSSSFGNVFKERIARIRFSGFPMSISEENKANVGFYFGVSGTEEIGDVSVTTYQVGYKLLDGTKMLDGSETMNSIYRRETI